MFDRQIALFKAWLNEHPLRLVAWGWLVVAAVALLLLIGVVTCAHAQSAPAVTLSASPTAGISPLDVTLTWSSSGAASCTASGAWSGTKAASGTEVVRGLMVGTKTFTLACSAGSAAADLAWNIPTKNTDGTTLTDLAGFKLRGATSAAGLATATAITAGPTASALSIPNLGAGTWYFDIRSYNAGGIDSVVLGPVTLVVSLPSGSASQSVTVSTQPNPPSGFTAVQRLVYDLKRGKLNRLVGYVPIGTVCGEFVVKQAGARWYSMDFADVSFTSTPRSTRVVAPCAAT